MFNIVSVNYKCIKQNKHEHSTKCFLYENEEKKKKMAFKILLNQYLKRIQLILVKKCDGYIEIKLVAEQCFKIKCNVKYFNLNR